jgi:hypothetical protein
VLFLHRLQILKITHHIESSNMPPDSINYQSHSQSHTYASYLYQISGAICPRTAQVISHAHAHAHAHAHVKVVSEGLLLVLPLPLHLGDLSLLPHTNIITTTTTTITCTSTDTHTHQTLVSPERDLFSARTPAAASLPSAYNHTRHQFDSHRHIDTYITNTSAVVRYAMCGCNLVGG